jgi:hypothetical protein
MAEDYNEPTPEPAPETELVPEPATEVVTSAEIILDHLAEQLRLVLDGQRMLQRVLPTVAHAQTAILDEMRAIREMLVHDDKRDNEILLAELRAIREILARDGDRVRRLENSFDSWVAASLTTASTPG